MSEKKKERLIVSSRHLATGENWPVSEFEFGLTVVNNAFQKWITKCASAAGQNDLSALDVLIIHNINHRDTPKRRIDICFVLNIEDSHTVNYALKKLLKPGLIKGEKQGKEIFYTMTAKGVSFCEEYKKIREQCLISDIQGSYRGNSEELSAIAEHLHSLSGLYDQAARAAASL